MKIQLLYNTEDNRKIRKTPRGGVTLTGELTLETSISQPVIDVETSTVPRYNYAYIPDFCRYYYIDSKENVGFNLWRLHLTVDVLMSFKRDILGLYAVIDKSAQYANGDEYIDDGSLVSSNRTFSQVINYPEQGDKFADNPGLILITAG